jgi:hypothetical protein
LWSVPFSPGGAPQRAGAGIDEWRRIDLIDPILARGPPRSNVGGESLGQRARELALRRLRRQITTLR